MKYTIGYIILILLFSSCFEKEHEDFKYIAFTDVIVIDGKGNPPQTGMVLIIKDSIIYDVAKMKGYQFPENTKNINAKGKYIIPGLFDMHAHVTVLPIDSNKRLIDKYDKEASFASLKTMLAYGITTVRNPSAPTNDGVELRELVRHNESILSPNIYTSGAALKRYRSYFGPFAVVTTKEDVRKEVIKQINAGVDFIKVYATLNPNLVKAAIDEAHKHNIKVIGHLQNTTWTEAAKLGIDYITHAAPWSGEYLPKELQKNYRPSMLGRLYWLENVDYESDGIKELLNSLLENKVSVDPTLIAFHTKFWGNDTLYTQSPDLKLAHTTILNVWNTATFTDNWTDEDFKKARSQWKKLLQLTKLMYDKGILITAGSDFPNPWILPGKSLHQEMELLNEAGISNLEILKIATYNGALSLGIENVKGSVEKGKIADLVILSENPIINIQNTQKIDYIIKDGKIYTPNELINK